MLMCASLLPHTPGFAEGGCRTGSFREDLYHRLNVIRVHVPSLPDRRDNIAALAQHFAAAAAAELEILLNNPGLALSSS
jgi:DNA-binding NtrC family response regulator